MNYGARPETPTVFFVRSQVALCRQILSAGPHLSIQEASLGAWRELRLLCRPETQLHP